MPDPTMQPNIAMLLAERDRQRAEVSAQEEKLRSLTLALQEKDDSVRQARKALQLARERKIKISKAIKRQDVQDQLAKLKKIALRTKKLGELRNRERELACQREEILEQVSQIEKEYFQQIRGPCEDEV